MKLYLNNYWQRLLLLYLGLGVSTALLADSATGEPCRQEHRSATSNDASPKADHAPTTDDADHDNHDDHNHGAEGPIRLTARDQQDFGIKVAKARRGEINEGLIVPGEIQINENAIANVSPRFSGAVTAIAKRLGDTVTQGEVLATLESNETLQNFDLVAPIAGQVITFNLTLGESLAAGQQAYVIANTSTLWADLQVYQKELPKIRQGQPVAISAGRNFPIIAGTISYIGPKVNEQTRTGLARAVIPNPDGLLRPGLFVTGRITVNKFSAPIVVPLSAIHSVKGEDVVYVTATEQRFIPRTITIGRRDSQNAEITAGLTLDETYAAEGGFFLKADSQKENFGNGHAH